MTKIWCCGICSTEEDKIRQIINATKGYVNGFVWCVDSNPASDNTAQLLADHADEGRIFRHSWICAHDFQANEWLHSGVIKSGDWVLMVDSSEIPQPVWVKGLRDNIKELESQGLSALYASGRPYLFKFDEYLFFHGTPHWGLCGFTGKAAQLNDEDKKKIITNLRDLNPGKHYQEHDTKYYVGYGRSNIIDAFYGKYGQGVVNFHEQKRREFRAYLRRIIGEEPSLTTLDKFLSFKYGEHLSFRKAGHTGDSATFTEYDQNIIELEFCLSEYFQRTVLGMDFITTMHPRERWSFKIFLATGDGWSDKSYLGTRLKYDWEISKQYDLKSGQPG